LILRKLVSYTNVGIRNLNMKVILRLGDWRLLWRSWRNRLRSLWRLRIIWWWRIGSWLRFWRRKSRIKNKGNNCYGPSL